MKLATRKANGQQEAVVEQDQDNKADKLKPEPAVAPQVVQPTDPEEEEETLGWQKHREAQRRPRPVTPS